MYIVPMEMPKHCNHCPFGICDYSFPLGSSSISHVDGKENKPGTHGYICNIDFSKNGKYTRVMRANCEEDIRRPRWCGLMKG